MHTMKDPTFTISYKKSITGEGYIGFVLEVPGAASQGKTKPELVKNLREAVLAIFEANRLEALEKNNNMFDKEEYQDLSVSII